MIMITWTAGTALVMWLAELITQRGIGNGMSILIFASVLSRMPFQGGALVSEAGPVKFTVVLGIGVVMILGIVAVESGQRRIPVQFAKRMVGRRMYGGQSTYIPLKVNQSGVIPVIFASFAAFVSGDLGDGAAVARCEVVDQQQSRGNEHLSWFYILAYALLILFFSYFYPRSPSIRRSRPTSSASREGSSRGSGPGRRPSGISQRCSTASRSRRAIPDRHRAAPDVRAEVLEHQPVPVRRRIDSTSSLASCSRR